MKHGSNSVSLFYISYFRASKAGKYPQNIGLKWKLYIYCTLWVQAIWHMRVSESPVSLLFRCVPQLKASFYDSRIFPIYSTVFFKFAFFKIKVKNCLRNSLNLNANLTSKIYFFLIHMIHDIFYLKFTPVKRILAIFL